MPITTSLYMNLPLPVPTRDPGPLYATHLNTCLTYIDAHDHTPGKGLPINSAGISINADLEFNGFSATELKSAKFEVQASPLSSANTLGSVYVSGVDLYYNDVSGNQIRMTQSGGVAGTPGSITGLVPPASVVYTPGDQTYTFQSTTATAGNLDGGSLTIREVLASANGITLASPTNLAADYTYTLPGNLPSTGALLRSDASGNLSYVGVDNSTIIFASSSISLKAGGVSPTYLAPKTITRSQNASSAFGGVYGGSFRELPEFRTTVVTTGTPVRVGLESDGSLSPLLSTIGLVGASAETSKQVYVRLTRNSSAIADYAMIATADTVTSLLMPPSMISKVDNPASSSWTYSLWMQQSGTGTCRADYMNLIVYNL